MQVTTGARSDLQRATRWARHMVAECGMSDAIGPLFADQQVRHAVLPMKFLIKIPISPRPNLLLWLR